MSKEYFDKLQEVMQSVTYAIKTIGDEVVILKHKIKVIEERHKSEIVEAFDTGHEDWLSEQNDEHYGNGENYYKIKYKNAKM